MPLVKHVQTTASGLVAITSDGQEIPVTLFGEGKAKVKIKKADRDKSKDSEALKRAALDRFTKAIQGPKVGANHYYQITNVRVKFDEANYLASIWIDHEIYTLRKTS